MPKEKREGGRAVKTDRRPVSSLTIWFWRQRRLGFSADQAARLAMDRACGDLASPLGAYRDRRADTAIGGQRYAASR